MKKTVGDNLKIYRMRANLSMKDAGKLLNLSAPAILKFERNQIIASLDRLEKFAAIYNVTVEEILDVEKNIEIKYNNFKCLSKTSVVTKEKIKHILTSKIENYFTILEMSEIQWKNKFGVHLVSTILEAESLATKLRIYFTIPLDDPIYNLINLLENHEMMIITIPRNEITRHFVGFYEIINNVPVIAVLEADNGYEQRFNIAKYLGELLIVANHNKDELTTEFALSLLIPKASLIKEFEQNRIKISFEEIVAYSNVYKVSYKNIVKRLLVNQIITPSNAKYTNIFINKNNIKETLYTEEPYVYNKLLYKLLAKNIIKDEKKYL